MHRARYDSAANHDGVAPILVLECLTDSSDVSQVEISVGLAWCSDTNEGHFRLVDRFARITGGP